MVVGLSGVQFGLQLYKWIVSLRNRTAERRGRQNAWVWRTWQGYYFRVLSWSWITLMFSGLLRKLCFTKLLSRLLHKVCRPLPSPVLLRKALFFPRFIFLLAVKKSDLYISASVMSHIILLNCSIKAKIRAVDIANQIWEFSYSYSKNRAVCIGFACYHISTTYSPPLRGYVIVYYLANVSGYVHV